MKRELFKKLSCYQGFKDISCDSVDPDFIPSNEEIDRIIRDIFSIDEISGLPKGDLAYYLSPDGNPTVKAWLENNLLKPRSVAGSSLDGLTDDMIEEYSRKSEESVSDYSSRLLGIYDSAMAEYNKSLEDQSKID